MTYDYLFREGRINGMTTRNRLHMGPAEKCYANRDGSMNQGYIDYLVARAKGGAALISIESTYVDVRGMGHHYQLGAHADHVIPGLRRTAEALHAVDSRVGLELYMGGRQSPAYMTQRQPVAPSPVKCEVLGPPAVPHELTKEEIGEIVEAFADGARRTKESGMDFVLLHGAHGYLVGQFLSPYSNKRTDEYGGSPQNRGRFGLEIVKAIRETCGDDFPIGYRITADEYIDGGLTIEDTTKYCRRLVDAGVDWIDTSGGIYESSYMIIQGNEAPKGGFVENAAAIKEVVGNDAAVSATQQLSDPRLSNEVMRKHGLDYVSITRTFHSDPDYGTKVAEGRIDEINFCISCHECVNLLEMNRRADCAINPLTGYESVRKLGRVSKPRNVMVVGGGPGGMEAARLLAEQGNRVTLYEKGSELGGQFVYSSRAADDYANFPRYLIGQLERLKVEVHTEVEVDYDRIAREDPDAVVIATGILPGIRFCPVVGDAKTFDLFTSIDRDDDAWEDEVVVIGGDFAICFTALYVAGRGAEVTIVEPGSTIAFDKHAPGKNLLIKALSDLPTITIRTESTVEEVGEGYVLIQQDGKIERKACGSAIFGGRVPNDLLYDEIKRRDPTREVYNIGDSVLPRLAYDATQEAWKAAELICLRA
jgi:2,4-dienoyl-CoA reductase-like NADH-dependent reductase (Old Yellow Enzyme family)/thioredoxin reductase